MCNEAYFIVDIGTGNSRVVLMSVEGELIGIRSFANPYHRDYAYEDALYFLPEDWSALILSYVKEMLISYPGYSIKAFTSTSARESVVLLNKEGKAFYGLPNIDNRGDKWIGEIPNGHEIYYKTGRWLSGVFSAGKLLGLRKRQPEIYKKIFKITSMSDWIGYLFTGNLRMEHSQACETQVFDIGRQEWSRELCSVFGIEPDILPALVTAGKNLGHVNASVCQELGISADVVFVVGGADTQMAVKGMDAKQKDVVIVSGTTSPIVTIVPYKFYDERQRCWTDSYIDGKSYQIETNAGVTGLNYQRMKSFLFPDVTYEKIEEELQKIDRVRCIASFGTLIFSENRSLQNGGFYMSAPLDENLNRYDLAYALIADIACGISKQYHSLCEMTSHDENYVLGCGGGFRSAMLGQLTANLLQRKLILREGYGQASARGCVRICNDYFGYNCCNAAVDKVYEPENNQMIHEYSIRWEAVRNKIGT